jgi:protease I
MRIVSLVHNEFDDLEFWYPTIRLREAGHVVDVTGESAGVVYHGKYGVPAESTHSYETLDSATYDGVIIPGGWAPDRIRRFPAVLNFIRELNAQGKVIGQICHAGWVTASAGILTGRTVTSTPGIKDDLTHAGATWVDQPLVVDGNLISARRPPDLPFYGQALVDTLSHG